MATRAKINWVEGKEGEGGVNLGPVRPKITPAMKQRAAVLFAQFQGPTAVSQAIEAEFGVAIPTWDICQHDPSKPYYRGAKRLKEVFDIARRKFVDDISEVGVAHQSYRLRALERMARTAELQGQLSLSAQLLKQAAEETGGVFTNVTKVKHSGTVAAVHLSVDDAKRELAMRLAGMVEDRALLPAPDEGTKDS